MTKTVLFIYRTQLKMFLNGELLSFAVMSWKIVFLAPSREIQLYNSTRNWPEIRQRRDNYMHTLSMHILYSMLNAFFTEHWIQNIYPIISLWSISNVTQISKYSKITHLLHVFLYNFFLHYIIFLYLNSCCLFPVSVHLHYTLIISMCLWCFKAEIGITHAVNITWFGWAVFAE